MKTNQQIIAGISAVAVLAMVTPAYAGLFGAGAGALGGSMTGGLGGLSGGGMTGQGAFDGRGAADTSFDRFPERTPARAKPAAVGADAAQRSSGTAGALGGSIAHEAAGSAAANAQTVPAATTPSARTPTATMPSATTPTATTPSASTPSAATPGATSPTAAPKRSQSGAAPQSAPPVTMMSGSGTGSFDAQHSRDGKSAAVEGQASASASQSQ